MFDVGPNTLWLDLHGLLMFLLLVFSAFLFGAIFFAREPDKRVVTGLKISSMAAFVLLMGLMISGIIPDIAFNGTNLSHTTTNDFGAFSAQVTDDNVSNFAGPLLFDVMEHVSLIVPALAAVVGFLIFHYGRRVMTNPQVKRSVLSLMVLTGVWVLALGGIGVFITKVLTFPTGR